MRHFLLVPALQVVLLTIGTFAQTASPTSSNKNAKLPEPCRVSGQVVNAADGASLKSARVALIEEDGQSHPLAFGTTSDSDGHFDIKNIAPGRYRFFASHTGYISQRYKGKDASSGAMLSLTPGQEIPGVIFRLIRGAVVTGRVVDESGEPMGNVVVAALRKLTADEQEDWGPSVRKDRMLGARAARTDDRGEYRLFGLKPGDYYIKAAESSGWEMIGMSGMIDEGESLNWAAQREFGSAYAPLYYPGVLYADQAQALTLHGGDEVAADFTMQRVKSVEVSGSVVGADGKPANGVYVSLSMVRAEDSTEGSNATTDENGKFHIKGVQPGSYLIEAQRQEGERHDVTRQKLEVAEENVDSVVLAFGRGVTITGHIVAADGKAPAFDQMQVMLEPTTEDDSASMGWADVKKDGSFEATDVVDGNYAVRVYSGGLSLYMKAAHSGADDVLVKGLEVEKGSSGGTLAIVLSSATAQLEGMVTEHDKPVAGAKVRARPDPETSYNRMLVKTTETDQNGHFRLIDIAPGKYRVVAKEQNAEDTPSLPSKPKVVELVEHDHQNVELVIPDADTQDATPQ